MIVGLLLAAFALYAALYLGIAIGRGAASFGDAFGIWSWGRVLAGGAAATLYDPVLLKSAQVAIGMDPASDFPFAYPPSYLLLLAPLGRLPLEAAVVAVPLLTLPFYLWATVGRRWRSPALAAALLAPTTTLAIVAGQTAFLWAALLVGGVRLLQRRPLLAGVLFGLLSGKPQFGLLLPVALLAARAWKTIAAAGATVLLLVGVTSVVFGSGIWPAWLAALPAYSRQFSAESAGVLHLMPTVSAGLLQAGCPQSIAQIAQILATLVAAALVWAAFRRGPKHLAAPLLLVAGIFATPYAFAYDLPVVATAVIWVVAERRRTGDPLRASEAIILATALIAPVTLPAGPAPLPLCPVSLALLLGLIVRRMRAGQDAPPRGHEVRSGISLKPSDTAKVKAEIAAA